MEVSLVGVGIGLLEIEGVLVVGPVDPSDYGCGVGTVHEMESEPLMDEADADAQARSTSRLCLRIERDARQEAFFTPPDRSRAFFVHDFRAHRNRSRVPDGDNIEILL